MPKKKEITHFWDPKFKRVACGTRAELPKLAQNTRELTCKNCIWAAGIGRNK